MHEVDVSVSIGAQVKPCEKEHCGCENPGLNLPLSPLEQAQARSQALAAERAKLVKRGTTLQYVTIVYTSLEAVIALISGTIACSIALVGFGLDSAIEVTSSMASLYRLKTDGKALHRNAEMLSLKITGWCFIALAAYVGFEALSALIKQEEPSRSVPGLILAAVSVFFMPWLARAKREIANKLGSRALETDSKQALFCSYLSGILLIGLVLNATLHWWWADSAAALVMVPMMVREGILALQGKSCCGGTCE
jgi:divalent metal cation (Fe/Co/Zn/Cd) transporter